MGARRSRLRPRARASGPIRTEDLAADPDEAIVVDLNGENIGGVIVFADDGYLSNLEIFWHDVPISPFPPLDRLQLSKGHS